MRNNVEIFESRKEAEHEMLAEGDSSKRGVAGKSGTGKSTLREYVEAIVMALVLALVLRAYVVEAFKIPSGSMIPTLVVGDHLLVNKLVYGLDLPFVEDKVLVYRNPRIYDIIVFKYPKDPGKNFIKRVMGVEGDKVEIRDKDVFVNGQRTEDPFVQHTDTEVLPAKMSKRDNFGPITVPEGKVFVMGDNRDDSHDSRYWGFVDLNEIKGKAMFIYWSWDGDSGRPRLKRIGRGIK
jgi:signal peptidase I